MCNEKTHRGSWHCITSSLRDCQIIPSSTCHNVEPLQSRSLSSVTTGCFECHDRFVLPPAMLKRVLTGTSRKQSLTAQAFDELYSEVGLSCTELFGSFASYVDFFILSRCCCEGAGTVLWEGIDIPLHQAPFITPRTHNFLDTGSLF